jgi:hypothetical protein
MNEKRSVSISGKKIKKTPLKKQGLTCIAAAEPSALASLGLINVAGSS